MKSCAKCQKPFKTWIKIKEKYHNLNNRKFCLTCSPFLCHNTRDITKPASSRCYDPNNPNGKGSYKWVKKFREKRKIELISMLGGACKICGYNKSHKVLEFHHLDPSKKNFSVAARINLAWHKIISEIKKCVLLCPNCHREYHLGLTKLP
jgi:hypothetical protein